MQIREEKEKSKSIVDVFERRDERNSVVEFFFSFCDQCVYHHYCALRKSKTHTHADRNERKKKISTARSRAQNEPKRGEPKTLKSTAYECMSIACNDMGTDSTHKNNNSRNSIDS